MGGQIKKMRAKVIHKYETEANWNLSNYIPAVGEIVFYDIDETHNYIRQKNGDGIHKVKDLPFTATEKELSKKQDQLHNYNENYDEQNWSNNSVTIHTGGTHAFGGTGVQATTYGTDDRYSYSAYNRYGKAEIDFSLMEGRPSYTHQYNEEGYENGEVIIKHFAFLSDIPEDSGYDLVVESDDDFDQCLYPLYKNEENLTRDQAVALFKDKTQFNQPSDDFTARKILVKGVTFTKTRGYDDIRLHIFQPSIEYIKFDNCTWNAKWRVSGKAPTTLKSTGTEYERAPGDLQLVVDGIHITEINIVNSINYANEHLDKPSEFWGVGLRNIKGIVNCTVDYPEDYKVVPYDTGESSGYTYSFKLTAQYFDYADNNKITGLWDGTNISNCHIAEGIYRSSNCNNIVAMPILDENDNLTPVQLRTCHNLSNFKGDFMDMVYGTPSYPECTAINYATCDWAANKESFDFIIESQGELTKLLQNTSSFQNKRILLKNISLNSGNIALTGASYVTFSNVEINEGATSLIGASVFECSGLRFASTQCRLAFKGSGNIRPRVYNMGAGASINNIIGYCMYENCDGVSNSIIHFADKTNHIHSCIVNTTPDSFDSIAGQDPWFRLCNDIIGVRIISEPSNVKFDRCNFVSHISSVVPSVISYMSCTKVDVMTCDNVKSAQIADAPYCPKPNRSDVTTGAFALYAQKHDGSNASKLAAVGNESGEISLGSGVVPIRASGGHILVPITPTEGNHAISMQYLDSKGYQSYSQIESEYAKKDAVCPKPNRTDFSTGFALYAQKPDGSNGSKVAQVGNESGTVSLGSGVIPIRASNGQLLVPITPTENNHAVSKQYLESKLSSISVDLTGYATEDWVQNQSYITNGDLNIRAYATESWVENKGYLTEREVHTMLVPANSHIILKILDESGRTHEDYGQGRYFREAYSEDIYDSYLLAEEAHYNGDVIYVPRICVKTKEEYERLTEKDPRMIYIIKEE